MWWVLALGFLLVSCCVLAFLNRVTKLSVIPAYVSVLAFVAFFIPTSIVVLLPVDLASGRADFDHTTGVDSYPLSYLSHTVLLKIWRASYWLSFSLTLTILPLMQSFVESGYRQPLQRFVSSVRQNLRFQAMYLTIAVLGIIYIAFNTKLNSIGDYKSLLIALANTWGLFLAINFLGHGLVNIPRRLWRSADYARQIRELGKRASTLHEKLEDATTEENELAHRVVALERTEADKDWLEEMASFIPSAVAKARAFDNRSQSSSSWFSGAGRNALKAPTDAEMASLMSKIRTSKSERYAAEWRQLVIRYTYLLDCTTPSSNRTLEHRTFRSRLSPRLAFYWYVHLVPFATRVAAILSASVSLSILWAEILINEQSPKFLRFITIPITEINIEFFSALLMMYMACCCYSTLLRLKIFDRYALLSERHTSPSSLFFYASYLCRVTIPLSYNFITLLPLSERDRSTFSHFLGSAIDLSPLGTAFNNWFPLYILVPVGLTLVNSYDRLKRSLMVGDYAWMEDDDDEGGSGVEGRLLLKHEIGMRYGELPVRSSDHDRNGGHEVEDVVENDGGDQRIRFANDEDDEGDEDDTAPFIGTSGGATNRSWSERSTFDASAISRELGSRWGSFKEKSQELVHAARSRLLRDRDDLDARTV